MVKLIAMNTKNLTNIRHPIAHEIQRVESPTAISQICLRLVSSSVALVRWPDNRTRGRRLRAASFSIFDKVDLAQLAKSDVNCAWAADENVAIPGRCKAATSRRVRPHSRWKHCADGTPQRSRIKVFLHTDFRRARHQQFEKLKNAPDKLARAFHSFCCDAKAQS